MASFYKIQEVRAQVAESSNETEPNVKECLNENENENLAANYETRITSASSNLNESHAMNAHDKSLETKSRASSTTQSSGEHFSMMEFAMNNFKKSIHK